MKSFVAGFLAGTLFGATVLFIILLCNSHVFVTFRQ